MNLSVKKYSQIVNLAKKNKFTIFEMLTNYGLFSGDRNLFKTLKIFELLLQIKDINGDIIELGIHKGNTSLLLKKILSIYKIKKKIYLLDHFEGLIHYTNKDPKASKIYQNKFKSPKKLISDFISFFNFKDIHFIHQDATKLNNKSFNNKKFCFVYMDMDLYEPTLKALLSIDKKVVKGGIIVFDEGHKKVWDGEKKAIQEFLKNNRNYKYFLIDKSDNRQPDVYLKKIR